MRKPWVIQVQYFLPGIPLRPIPKPEKQKASDFFAFLFMATTLLYFGVGIVKSVKNGPTFRVMTSGNMK